MSELAASMGYGEGRIADYYNRRGRQDPLNMQAQFNNPLMQLLSGGQQNQYGGAVNGLGTDPMVGLEVLRQLSAMNNKNQRGGMGMGMGSGLGGLAGMGGMGYGGLNSFARAG
jgi:hypothetical protein